MYRDTAEDPLLTLKRQLNGEALRKFDEQVPLLETIPRCPLRQRRKDRLFVVDWIDSLDGRSIMAYGTDERGFAYRMPVNARPGIFVLTRREEFPVLRTVCQLLKYGSLTRYDDCPISGNNYTVFEALYDHSARLNGRSCLVKIECDTLQQARAAFYRFRRDRHAYRYAAVPFYWSNVVQIMFEVFVRRGGSIRHSGGSKIPNTMAWFDADLHHYAELEAPQLPVITFDIETVSTDANRVPTGEDADDELFSVSVHHVTDNIMYTLMYLPVARSDSTDALRDELLRDGYPEYPRFRENRVEIFASERALLRRTMQLIALPRRMHYLVGYNSLNYDIKYLLTRCAFHRMSEALERFVYRDGYCYGWNQLHIDLFRVVMMRFKFRSYGLGDVANELLRETKSGVSAVALRFTFHAVRRDNRYIRHDESTEWPSLRDIAHYNNQDTALVSRLIEATAALNFVRDQVNSCGIPYTLLQANYNKMRYKLWSRCFMEGLLQNLYFATFKSPVTEIRCPERDNSDAFTLMLDLETQLNDEASLPFLRQFSDRTVVPVKYPGGANFCHGKHELRNVTVLDYRVAYPLMIERKNISDETASIAPAAVLLAYLVNGCLSEEQAAAAFDVYDYMAHTGINRTQSAALYHRYIYDAAYCGNRFDFTRAELLKRANNPIIVIWRGLRGVLPRIVERFNVERENIKNERNMLRGIVDYLTDYIGDLRNLKCDLEAAAAESHQCLDGEAFERDFDDNDSDGEELGDGGHQSPSATAHRDSDSDGEELVGGGAQPAAAHRDSDSDGEELVGGAAQPATEQRDSDSDGEELGAPSPPSAATEQRDDSESELGATVARQQKRKRESDGDVAPVRRKHKASAKQRYAFVDRFFRINENRTCSIDESALAALDLDERIALLELKRQQVSLALQLAKDSYALQKAVVSSIYGCIGSSSRVCAAIVTFSTRMTLLLTAQYLVSEGYIVYYIDTDSLFIKHSTDPSRDLEDPSPRLNSLFPHAEIERSVLAHTLLVKSKIHIDFLEDGEVAYGQHVNGPDNWRAFVKFVAAETGLTTSADVSELFERFFEQAYERIERAFDAGDCRQVVSALFSQIIKVQRQYKSLTPIAKYRQWVLAHYPAIAQAYKHEVYMSIESGVNESHFRPTCHFTQRSQLRTVNLFKYYQNNFTTVLYIIEMHLRRNNRPFNIAVSSKQILLTMLSAFVRVHERRFVTVELRSQIPESAHAVTDDVDVDDDNE